MTSLKALWHNYIGRQPVNTARGDEVAVLQANEPAQTPALEITPHDPLLAYVQQTTGVIDVERLQLESPALEALRAAGVQLIVPLVSQGELIGMIHLGGRLSEQAYSSDDRKLLSDLASQAAPALRVAQLVRQQQLEAAERQRIEHELRVASIIQQTLLPQETPAAEGWEVMAYYRPAREVGGDFYDFIYFPDGRIGFIVADVTDKGVPAAMVMATTRSILRAAAERLVAPGAVLERTNDVLHPEIPAKMFVTCFYAVLDPATGHLCFANAGHDVPYRYTGEGIAELRATGMPLGLMPGMQYEEKETTLEEGDYVLLYSDGLVEAHNEAREMFGFPRLQTLLATHADGTTVTDYLLDELATFTGPAWEQEDDVTLVSLQRAVRTPVDDGQAAWSVLRQFELASEVGNERQAMEQVATVVADLPLASSQLERLKTAVAEATMNAMEHGNQYDATKPVQIEVATQAEAVRVRIVDQGGGKPTATAETPDLEAKLAGAQSPRGWGLFLIENMVDEMQVRKEGAQHTVELIMNLSSDRGE